MIDKFYPETQLSLSNSLRKKSYLFSAGIVVVNIQVVSFEIFV